MMLFPLPKVPHGDGAFSGSMDASDSKVLRRRDRFAGVEADHGDAGAYPRGLSVIPRPTNLEKPWTTILMARARANPAFNTDVPWAALRAGPRAAG